MSKPIPPLLLLAEGRKPRLRKAPVDRPKEVVLHMSVAATLRKHARPDWQWTHIANGELRDKRTAGKLRQMGAKAGWPDFVLVPPTGQLHCIELKRLGETLSEPQENFRMWCVRFGLPHVVAYTLDEVMTAFDVWHVLRIEIATAAERKKKRWRISLMALLDLNFTNDQRAVRERAYALAALDGAQRELAQTLKGNRNNTLNAITYRMGRMVGAGWLTRDEAGQALTDACFANGLWREDRLGCATTLKHALASGICNPCEPLPDSALNATCKPIMRICSSMERPAFDDGPQRIAAARWIWGQTQDARGSVAERYLNSRRLELPNTATDIRFHPDCAFGNIGAPTVVCAMRDIESDEIKAVHRTFLTETGEKIDRRMRGVARGTAIKIDPAGPSLTIGEGIETCLAARQMGLAPVWAMGSSAAIAKFPVLENVDILTLLGERDEASQKAINECAARWYAAGRCVRVNLPPVGFKDHNDWLIGGLHG